MSLPPLNLSAFAIGLLLLAGAVLPLNACVRHTRRPAFLTGLFLVGYAEIVLIAQAASVIHWLNLQAFILGEMAIAAAAQVIWRKAGRPALSGPFSQIQFSLPPFRADPALWILGIGSGLALLFNAALILATPPNNYDSMTYHLGRVGFFIQHQTFSPWLSPDIRQVSFPYHAEIGVLWTILLANSDRMAGFVQWTAAITAAIATTGLARLLGASIRQSLFAGLILFTFPIILLESATTQNDLVAAAFASSGLYLFALGIRQKRSSILALSAVAFALGFGTKTTLLLALPGLAAAGLIFAWPVLRSHFSLILGWAVSAALAFLILSSLVFIQNIRYFKNPISSNDIVAPVIASLQTPFSSRVASNLLMYIYQGADLSGLPGPLASGLLKSKESLFSGFMQTAGLPFPMTPSGDQTVLPDTLRQVVSSEEFSWFGIEAFFLFAIGIILSLRRAIHKRQAWLLAPVIFLVLFWLTLSIGMVWTPFKGRYFVLAAVGAAPILAWTYPERKTLAWLRWALILPALLIAAVSILQNSNKPLVGPNAIWGLSPLEVQTSGMPNQKPVIEALDTLVPPGAVLATRLGNDDWNYLLFGAQFQRRIIPLDPALQTFNKDLLKPSGASYLLVSPAERNFLGLPEGMKLVTWFPNDWLLLQPADGPVEPLPADVAAGLLGAADRSGMFKLSPAWQGQIGLTQIESQAPWEIEKTSTGVLFWLGTREAQSLKLHFWSNLAEDTAGVLALQLSPGPSRPDAKRTLVVRHDTRRLNNFSSRVIQHFSFDRPGIVEVPLTFKPGINEIVLSIVESATIEVQPNGDPRPLMALLTGITLQPAKP